MANGLLEFGDVFEYEGSEYIFLASRIDVIYVAKILDSKLSNQLYRQCSKLIAQSKRLDKPLYCFVILITEELKDRAAHFGVPEKNPQIAFKKVSIVLNDNDLINLKKEIENSRAAPLGLREIIGKIEVRKSGPTSDNH